MRISDWSSDVCSSDLIAAPIAIQNETIRKNAIHYRQIARDFAQTNFTHIRSLATKRFDLNLPRVGARLEAGCDKLWGDRDAGSATRGIFRRLAGVAGGETRPAGAGEAADRGTRRRDRKSTSLNSSN